MTNELYAAPCRLFIRPEETEFLDGNIWATSHKIITTNVCLVDRTENLKIPYNIKLFDKFKIPKDLNNFTMTYEDCCIERAQEIYAISKNSNKPIYVFYSGGIDSTLVLISFLKVIPKDDRDRLSVFMTMDSIRENPKFYREHIRGKINFFCSEGFSNYFNKESIFVGGELQDQLMGSDTVNYISNNLGFEKIHEKLNKEFIFDLMQKKKMDELTCEVWWEAVHQSTNGVPIKLNSNFDFLWWLNFNFKWQSVYFRLAMRTSLDQRENIDNDFFEKYYHHFFSSVNFQKWSMINQNEKIESSWKTYKNVAKKIIFDYTKDEDYFLNKIKIPSLYRIFLCKNTGVGVTTDYKIIDEIDPKKYYVQDNDFRKIIETKSNVHMQHI